jgi:glycosyltransferase involved in cell wall biosynthesis
MRIAIAAPLIRPITSELKYGALERVVADYAKGLSELGHEVIVFARPSTNLGSGIEIREIGSSTVELTKESDKANLDELFLAQAKAIIDYVISSDRRVILSTHKAHTLKGLSQALQVKQRQLFLKNSCIFATVHAPAERTGLEPEILEVLNVHLIAISQFQAGRLSDIGLNPVGVVPNSVDINIFSLPDERGVINKAYTLTLGRVTEEKGIRQAILASRAAGLECIIAGPVSERDEAYFDSEIKPLIDLGYARWAGSVGDHEKIPLLQNALTLLHLVNVDESFGLSVLESLLCGTPVIATSKGALPELVTTGTNGYLIDPTTEVVAEAARILKLVKNMNPSSVRSSVLQKFSRTETMRKLEELLTANY